METLPIEVRLNTAQRERATTNNINRLKEKVGRKKAAEILSCSTWSVTAWIKDDDAPVAAEYRAQEYLSQLDNKAAPTPPPATPQPVITPSIAPQNASTTFVVEVPAARMEKFAKLMAMLGLEYVDMD